MKQKISKLSPLILVPLVLLAFLLRLYRLNQPLADWHSWRQADTASVTRIFVQKGIDLLHPRFHDLSSIPSGLDNPQGWRFVEFPLVNGLTAFAAQFVPQIDLVILSRLTSIIFSLVSLLFLYLIVARLSSRHIALLSAFIFAVLPFNLYYSRAILPEPVLLSFSLVGLYFFIRYLDQAQFLDWLVSLVFTALAVLIKPYALFLGLPALYYAFKKYRFQLVKQPLLIVFPFLVVAPFLLWRLWEAQFPEGIPNYAWLFNSTQIRLRPAFFRWLFADRLGRLILGYWGLIPFSLGIIIKPQPKSGWFFHLWGLSLLLYLTVFATGNVTHDYYQIITLPLISVFMAQGFFWLISQPEKVSAPLGLSLACLSLIFCLSFSWFHVRDFFNINHPEIVTAGQIADQLLPPDAKVIAPYQGDTALLFQTNRSGWPIGGQLETRRQQGATHYLSVSFDDETNQLLKQCQSLVRSVQFVLIDLTTCR